MTELDLKALEAIYIECLKLKNAAFALTLRHVDLLHKPPKPLGLLARLLNLQKCFDYDALRELHKKASDLNNDLLCVIWGLDEILRKAGSNALPRYNIMATSAGSTINCWTANCTMANEHDI